jgi:molecular chaperone HtpG
MQVGEANLLDELFTEPRFNAWAVGEVHILDERIFPNGRRDHFEQSVHFHTVLNHLAPLTKDLGRRCRSSSVKRNWMRQFQQSSASVRDQMSVLRQGAVTQSRRGAIKVAIEERIARLQKIASLPMLDSAVQKRYSVQLKRFRVQLSQLSDSKKQHRRVARLRGSRRLLVQKLCDLVYENSKDQASARLLIERILHRL